ncbi:MAG: hypothetical protein ACPGJV_04520 [Bacteriovoracaceae bacterium]
MNKLNLRNPLRFKALGPLLLLLFSAQVVAKNYTLEDLRILAKEKNSEEFLKHALDLSPKQRTKEWIKLVQKMGTSEVERLTEEKRFSEKDREQVDTLLTWSWTKTNKEFLAKARAYWLKYTDYCLKSGQKAQCYKQSKNFWFRTQTDAQFGLDLAKKLSPLRRMVRDMDLWPMIESATTSQIASHYCSDYFVSSALTHKIIGDNIHKTNFEDLAATVQRMATLDCLNQIFPNLKQTLLSSSSTQVSAQENVMFWLVKNFEQFKLDEEDYYLFTSLLRNPVKGPLFNLAWNRVQTLRKHYNRRQKVISMMKVNPFIPDRTFSTLQPEKAKAIINLIDKNFPEFVSYYLGTCSDFYGAKRDFPRGNPTQNCLNFTKLYDKESIHIDNIQQKVRLQLSGRQRN